MKTLNKFAHINAKTVEEAVALLRREAPRGADQDGPARCLSLPFMGRDVDAKRRQGGVRMIALRPFRTPPGSLRDRPSP